jgi:hypothetical protein
LHKLFVTNALDDMQRIQDTRDDLLHGTCDWIFEDTLYKSFVQNKHSQLPWIHGDAGKGKTMIAISQILALTERIQQKSTGAEEKLLYFFCDNKDDRRNTAVAVLRSLLYQLLCQYPEGIRHFREESEKLGTQLFESQNAQQSLWRILQSVLQELIGQTTWLVIDALDECDPNSSEVLLNQIKSCLRKQVLDDDSKSGSHDK